jgi:predicted phage baseplate assembly protein
MQATLAAVHPVDAGRCELEVAPPISDALVRDTVVVYGNVIAASHGESVAQILGAGNASQPFQRFELKQQPLTYRAAANEIGAAAELTVRVGDIEWSERPTLFDATPTDRAYTIDTDEKGRTFVVFGDGVRGARLPSGVLNVRAAYRKGLGADGNVASDSLTQLVVPPLGVKSVSNPMAAEGGADPEPAAAARGSMPLITRTLGRAVSVLDYEDFARAYSGIAKAQARVLDLGSGRVVAITIAGPDGTVITPSSPTWTNLLAALRASGDPHVGVVLLAHQASTFRIGLRVKRDPAYDLQTVLDAVETTLRARYGFEQRGLTQAVQQSDVIATAQNVPGVMAVDITRLYGGTRPAAQTIAGAPQVRLLASQMRVEGGVARAAELLTLDPAPLDQLEEMT